MTNDIQTNEQGEMSEATQVVTTLAGWYERLQKILNDSRKALAEVLPPSIGVDRHIRTALTLWRTDEKLQKCDPASFAGAVMEAAQLHLSLDRNLAQAYIVPRWDKKSGKTLASILVGYPGLVKLSRDSGQVLDFTAALVRDGDDFDFALGTDKFLRHSWNLMTERGRIVGGYLFVKLTSGEQHLFLMTAAQLVEARERVLAENGIRVEVKDGVEVGYRQGRNGEYEVDSPWISDPEPMWVKTLIRRGSKTIPLGDGYTRAVALDEAHDYDRPQHLAENLRGVLPELAGAPAAPEDIRAQEATAAAAVVLADRIKAKAASAPSTAETAAPAPAETVPALPAPVAPVAAPAAAEHVEEPSLPAAEEQLAEMQRKLEAAKAKRSGGRKAKAAEEKTPELPNVSAPAATIADDQSALDF